VFLNRDMSERSLGESDAGTSAPPATAEPLPGPSAPPATESVKMSGIWDVGSVLVIGLTGL